MSKRTPEHCQKISIAKKGSKYNISPETHHQRYNTSFKTGRKAFRNKTGIFALPPEQQKENARKGGEALRTMMLDPERRKLHAMKIKYAKWRNRFNRAMFLES